MLHASIPAHTNAAWFGCYEDLERCTMLVMRGYFWYYVPRLCAGGFVAREQGATQFQHSGSVQLQSSWQRGREVRSLPLAVTVATIVN